MSVPINERRLSAPRVKFERPLDVRVMAIDGTSCRKCLLIDVSDTGARIKLTSPLASLTEFFLLLTTFGIPVFRRCSRQWVDGLLMGVTFEQGPIEEKSLNKLRHDAKFV
jgi:PilZ domain